MKLNTKSILKQTFWLYLPSLIILCGVLYTLQLNEVNRFDKATSINLTFCQKVVESNRELKQQCKNEHINKQRALKSEVYAAFSTAKILTKPFISITKQDHKDFERLYWNFIIESRNSKDAEKVKELADNLKPQINQLIDQFWTMLYLLVNPLIPLFFVILLNYIKQLLTPLVKRLIM